MTVSYFAVLFDDEVSVDNPDGIFRRIDSDARLELLNRKDGSWVDNPELAGYFRGERGAEPIDEAQARRIVEGWGFDDGSEGSTEDPITGPRYTSWRATKRITTPGSPIVGKSLKEITIPRFLCAAHVRDSAPR